MKVPGFFGAVCLAVLLVSASPSAAQTSLPPGATSPANEAKFGVYPIAYREIITRWLGERLVDAASAKIEMDEPKPVQMKTKQGQITGYAVDIRVNSRNKFGMYTGFQKWRLLLRNGEIIYTQRAK